ncbi:MAG TPA: PA14 domain-containing protein, partial [Flavisolibacter sp.]|nr:PA14 domain-containing protein [Flavisolibacter sp.]
IIHHNLFYRDKEAIRLWGRKEQPSDWGYAKFRDTRSMKYIIASNSFNEHDLALNISRTDTVLIFDNTYTTVKENLKLDSSVNYIDSVTIEDLLYELSADEEIKIPEVKNAIDPFKGNGRFAGRKNIHITEWGPYNFQYPTIRNTNPTDTTGVMHFEILGPKGKWKIISFKGVEDLSKRPDSLPSSITAKRIAAQRTNIEIVAEYIGPAFIDQFGNKIPAKKPHRFSFKKFFQPVPFVVKWFSFDSTNNPLITGNTKDFLSQLPIKTDTVNELSYAWWGGIKNGEKQYKQFLTIAEGSADILPGTYELGITWDDAVRVYVDDKLLINEWNPSKYKFDESPHKKVHMPLGGKHNFKVEHVELGGFATLSLSLRKIK